MPPALFPVFVSSAEYARFYLSSNQSLVSQNSELSMSAQGKDAYVLATGPSLKGKDLSFLNGEDCFSVSNFFLHEQIDVVSPKFHFFAPYHKPLILEEYIGWLRESDRVLPRETAIVFRYFNEKSC